MSIEITRVKGTYTYRVNPYAPTAIDRRENRHNARWQRYGAYESAEAARSALFALGRDASATPSADSGANLAG